MSEPSRSPTHYALGLTLNEAQGLPAISHGGEVSGFLALNTLVPTKNTGIVVLSNEDGVDMVPTVMREVAAILLAPGNAEADKTGRVGPKTPRRNEAPDLSRAL
jgi:hypothetical protein